LLRKTNRKAKKRGFKIVIFVCLFVIFLSISFINPNIDASIKNNENLSTATDNYLFNGKEYDITLDDVYDDENLTKIYTGANFQTVFMENDSTILSEVVSPVNNTNYKSPSNTGVSMITGTFDDTDNMKANDGSNSEFTSTEAVDDDHYPSTFNSFYDDTVGVVPDDWSGSALTHAGIAGHNKIMGKSGTGGSSQTFTDGTQTSGTIEFWWYFDYNDDDTQFGLYANTVAHGSTRVWILMIRAGYFRICTFPPTWSYRHLQTTTVASTDTWYHIKIDFSVSGAPSYNPNSHSTVGWITVTINDVVKETKGAIKYESNNFYACVFTEYKSSQTYYADAVGYSWDPDYDVGDNRYEFIQPAELDYTMDIDFSDLDTSNLLALDVSSFHYTDIATTIIGSIYDYNSGSYTQMFSSSNTAETENYFSDDTDMSNYLSGSGNLRLKFNGTNSADFIQIVDYIKIRFYYKMDLSHTISFETNGLWKYRWELIGSLHYTDWTYFEVVDPEPNFYAISESDLTTRWILQGAEISGVEDFNDDLTSGYWDLIDFSSRSFTKQVVPDHDSYVSSDNPTFNYGSDSDLWVCELTDTRITYLGFPVLNYFTENDSDTNTWIYLEQRVHWESSTSGLFYQTGSFDESTIKWNDKPTDIQHLSTDDLAQDGKWYSLDTHIPYQYYSVHGDNQGSGEGYYQFYSYEQGARYPQLKATINKNYHTTAGEGYVYFQTDTTESLGIISGNYGTHYNLSSGDYFEVDFQTSSDSKIELILLKDDVVNKTLTLSQSGNSNFNRRTAQISVDELVEFDQLKISSTLEDTDNIKIYDIKTYKYTITGDYADFFVGSERDYEVYLTPDTYNLRITEEGDEKINTNITISATGVLQYVYTPIERLECRLTLFNTEGSHLDFMDYHIKVNRSLNGIYNAFWLLDSIFSADEETYAYISIYDRFDTLIDTFERLTSDYIDLEIEVYSLQIKNLMEQKTTLDINGSYTYPLLSGDSIYFMLSKEYYKIGYYDSNDVYKQFSIYLDSNQAYELNRSRICFLSYADQQGNHLSFDNYKTYLNGSLLYENIFYKEIGDIIGIEIKDRYGISIKNDTYTVISGDNYIPITLTMYSLKIYNQQEVFNWVNITRDPNYYESSMYFWSEWVAPSEIIEFKLFAGYYKINLTNEEQGSSSLYSYTLNGDDVILISSGNIISNLITNIANVNTTVGNLITNVQIDLTNQNSNINNTIINIDINLSNVNSSLGTLLTNINLDIININNNISELYTFTENNFLNLGNNINNSFISIENNIIAINNTISTLVIGLDGKITIVNATINTMFTEMNSQFIVTQSTLDFSFTFLNQTITQIGNNITENHIALNNLIIQRANEIDNSLIQISTLVNLINSSVVNESLVVQSLVNIIGNNITENHIIINDLINLIGNNITENNINMVSLIELTGNNITTNQFVIQTLIDYVSNNITDNHLEFLTNINLINNTIDQNQIELINRLLFINNSINTMALDLTNQILLVNNTIYSAILDVSTSIDFNSDNILGNISLTYQQNDFLTNLYQETMFSQLLNWSGVAYNYSLMEDRIDVWEFINDYRNDSITVFLRYGDLVDNLTITAQNSIEQYLPSEDVEYRLWSVENGEYLTDWEVLPDNKTVNFGFFEEDVPVDPTPIITGYQTMFWFVVFFAFALINTIFLYIKLQRKSNKSYKKFAPQKRKKKKGTFNDTLVGD